MKIQVTLDFTTDLVDQILHSIMDNFPEASATLRCIAWDYDVFEFEFVDDVTNNHYNLNRQALEQAFPLMFTDKWPKGYTPIPGSTDHEVWNNWGCQADAQDFDAFVQLACLGEVIYG